MDKRKSKKRKFKFSKKKLFIILIFIIAIITLHIISPTQRAYRAIKKINIPPFSVKRPIFINAASSSSGSVM